MKYLIYLILFSGWFLPLAAQESPPPAPLPPPPDPFQETEDAFIKTTLLRQAIKQAASIRVLGMGRTRNGTARAILAFGGKRNSLVAEGDSFLLAAANGEPVEFKVISITERGVAVSLADGTQTLIE